MNGIVEYLKKQHGYARMSELKQAGFHTRRIRESLDKGAIEKVTAGLYRIADLEPEGDYSQGYIDVCLAMSESVICLLSALAYHNLSDVNPPKVYIALPNKSKQSKLIYPPVEVFFFRNNLYELGIRKVETPTGNFKIYDAEKTVCDIFRFRNTLGEDLALEALSNYLKRPDSDLIKLQQYAIKSHLKTILLPYLKAMVIK